MPKGGGRDAEKAGVQTYISNPMTFGSKAEARFSKADFVFDAKAEEHRRPSGQIPSRGADLVDGEGMVFHSDARYVCSDCPMKGQCTPASLRKYVPTEISLHVLAYDPRRLMSLLGIAGTTKAMRFAMA